MIAALGERSDGLLTEEDSIFSVSTCGEEHNTNVNVVLGKIIL
jgi:hypothetical protein